MLANSSKSVSAIRLPMHFDPTRLQADLARVPETDWQAHFNQRIYDGDWSVVPLRAGSGSPIPYFSLPNTTDAEDLPLLATCDYFRQVLSAFQCPVVSARLLRLGAGSEIKEHCDPMLSLDHEEIRLHVVVSTNSEVECRINGVSYQWNACECWYGDFTKPHSFANRGKTERIHIVLDCKLNDWLLQRIRG